MVGREQTANAAYPRVRISADAAYPTCPPSYKFRFTKITTRDAVQFYDETLACDSLFLECCYTSDLNFGRRTPLSPHLLDSVQEQTSAVFHHSSSLNVGTTY